MKILLSNVITVTKYKVFWAFFYQKSLFFAKKWRFQNYSGSVNS